MGVLGGTCILLYPGFGAAAAGDPALHARCRAQTRTPTLPPPWLALQRTQCPHAANPLPTRHSLLCPRPVPASGDRGQPCRRPAVPHRAQGRCAVQRGHAPRAVPSGCPTVRAHRQPRGAIPDLRLPLAQRRSGQACQCSVPPPAARRQVRCRLPTRALQSAAANPGPRQPACPAFAAAAAPPSGLAVTTWRPVGQRCWCCRRPAAVRTGPGRERQRQRQPCG